MAQRDGQWLKLPADQLIPGDLVKIKSGDKIPADFSIYLWERSLGSDLDTARTSAVNMLVACEIVYLINCRKITQSFTGVKEMFNSRAIVISILLVVAIQILFTYTPFMQFLFATTSILPMAWVRIAFISGLFFGLVEMEKRLQVYTIQQIKRIFV